MKFQSLISVLYLVATTSYCQIGLTIVNEQMVKDGVLEVYNKDFYSANSVKTAKVWLSDGSQNSEPKYISKDKFTKFNFQLDASNFNQTYIYYTYDLECIRRDIDKISRKVIIDKILSYGLNEWCQKETEKGNFSVSCIKSLLDTIKVARYNTDANFILEQLETEINNPAGFTEEEKIAVNEVYEYGAYLYLINQPKQIVELREMINLYLEHKVLRKAIASQVQEQKTIDYGFEIAYIQSNYKIKDFEGDLLYSKWNKKPTFSLRAYKFYDFKKNDTHLWPAFYNSIGFTTGSLAYAKAADGMISNEKGISYDNIDFKLGWTPFPWADKKIVLSLCLDAGLEARFKNEYTITRNNEALKDFDKQSSFEFESLNIAASVGLVLGIKPVMLRLVYNYSGNQNWLGKKDDKVLSLKTNRSASFSLILPIKNKKTYRYNRGRFSLF